MRLLHQRIISTAATISGSESIHKVVIDPFIRDCISSPFALSVCTSIFNRPRPMIRTGIWPSLFQLHAWPFCNRTRGKSTKRPPQGHHHVALPLFRASLSADRRADSHIICGCSQLIAEYSSATESRPGNAFFAPAATVADRILLRHGAYLVRDESEAALRQTPAACFAVDHFLRCLSSLLHDLAEESRRVYACVLEILGKLFAHEGDGKSECNAKAVILAARAKVSPVFWSAAKADEPRAIVVLAHFCVVFEKLNDDRFWYMKSWSRLIFEDYGKKLDLSWHGHLAWPVSFLGLVA